MGDATSQLADRIHFLRLKQPALEHSLLANVGQGAGELGGSILAVLHQHGLVMEMLEAAISALPAILDRKSTALGPLGKGRKNPFSIIGVKATLPKMGFGLNLVEAEAG
jgi:hypothetical protein